MSQVTSSSKKRNKRARMKDDLPKPIKEPSLEPQSSTSLTREPPPVTSMKKVIYLCKSFHDLQEKAKPRGYMDNFSAKGLLIKADKLFKMGEDSYSGGDEELAYIFYNRSLDAVLTVQSTEEYTQNEDYYDSMFPDEKCEHILRMLELIKASLLSRYVNYWKHAENKSHLPTSSQSMGKEDDNLEEKIAPKPDAVIQLQVSGKEYSATLRKMLETEDLLKTKMEELRCLEEMQESLKTENQNRKPENDYHIPDDMKCPFCTTNQVWGDVFVCQNGHRVCAAHQSTMPTCTVCGMGWFRLSENYLKTLERDCPFSGKGCKEKVRWDEMEQHKSVCKWNQQNQQDIMDWENKKLVITAQVKHIEQLVEIEKTKLEEMEEPLKTAGCENVPLEILRQRLQQLQMVISGVKDASTI